MKCGWSNLLVGKNEVFFLSKNRKLGNFNKNNKSDNDKCASFYAEHISHKIANYIFYNYIKIPYITTN